MKKTTRKLVLRKEIVRELSGQALTHVIGGLETNAEPFSRDRVCLTNVLGVALDRPRDGG